MQRYCVATVFHLRYVDPAMEMMSECKDEAAAVVLAKPAPGCVSTGKIEMETRGHVSHLIASQSEKALGIIPFAATNDWTLLWHNGYAAR